MWCALHLRGAKGLPLVKKLLFLTYSTPRMLLPQDGPNIQCDILVNDKSVSRKHADIELEFKGEMCEELTAEPRLYLIDKSKFGTFLNGEKCKEQRHLLKDRDQIRFGVNDACTYQVSLRPLIIFWEPASLGKSKSLIVKQTSLFGGRLRQSCEGCTYSLIEEISDDLPNGHLAVTLLQGLPCIAPSWLAAAASRTVASAPLPNIQEHAPIVPPTMSDIKLDGSASASLRTLLAGKTFVFLLDSQFEEFAAVVEMASGRAVKFSGLDAQSDLSPPATCVVRPVLAEEHVEIREKLQRLKATGINPIHPTDIYKAIIHNDTTTYCNPAFTPPQASVPMVSDIAAPSPSNSIGHINMEKPKDLQVKRSPKRKRAEMEDSKDQVIPPHDKKPISDNMNNEVEDGTGPRPPPMLIARSNLLARPFGTGSESILPNFKKFKKKSRSLVSVEDVQDTVSTHVIKCVLEETKPTEEMDAWLKDGATAEKEKIIADDAAESLWNSEVTAKKVPPQKKAKSTPAAGRGKGAEKRRRSNFI